MDFVESGLSTRRGSVIRATLLISVLLLTGCYSDTTIRTPEHQASVIELGRHLFYERRISLNNDRACGICHEQAKGFTDGFVRAVGTTGEVHPRNTHTVLNVESRNTLSWLHPETMTLSEHVLIPLLGTQPIEMGAQEKIQTMLAELNADPKYQELLGKVPGAPMELDLTLLAVAIAAFLRTLTDYDTRYDRLVQGDESALSDEEIQGKALFFSPRTGCSSCHGGLNLTDSKTVSMDGSTQGCTIWALESTPWDVKD